MKKGILKTLAVVATTMVAVNASYAVAPGFYMGLMMGPATNNGGIQGAEVSPGVTTPASPKATQFGSRVFMGYKINSIASTEFGISYFSSINYNTYGVQTCAGSTVRVRDFDLVGKAEYDFASFDVYGKAGAAFVYQTTSGGLSGNKGSGTCGTTTYTSKIKPTFSVGASYDLNQSWVADLSYNRINTGGAPNNVSLIALGISYHFVDIYCGQFLCN